MKRLVHSLSIFILLIVLCDSGFAQNIGINADGSAPDPNAILDIKSSTKGLLIPRTSTGSRLSIPYTKGLLLYDTSVNSFWYNDGNYWRQLANSNDLSGSVNYIPKFTGTSTIGNSHIADNGLGVTVGSSCDAQKINSFAEGNFSSAQGSYSISMGYNTVSSGNTSIALGNGVKASGDYSASIGIDCIASNYGAIAMGDQTTASGILSMALGHNVNAGGQYTFVWGNNSNTTGNSSYIFGTNLFDGGHTGNAMFGDTDPWNAGSVGSGQDNQMICRFNNGYYFLTGGNTNRTGMIANHGDNSWSQISDSTKKEKLIPVNGEELLNKISKFKLTTWNYKGQDAKIFRHYGPMAQDFHAAFGHDAIGTIGNDTLINQADFLGVSFSAIQALEKRTEKIEHQQEQIENLKKENASLAQSNLNTQDELKRFLSASSSNKTLFYSNAIYKSEKVGSQYSTNYVGFPASMIKTIRDLSAQNDLMKKKIEEVDIVNKNLMQAVKTLNEKVDKILEVNNHKQVTTSKNTSN